MLIDNPRVPNSERASASSDLLVGKDCPPDEQFSAWRTNNDQMSNKPRTDLRPDFLLRPAPGVQRKRLRQFQNLLSNPRQHCAF